MHKETDITAGIAERLREIAQLVGSQTELSKRSGVGLRLMQSYMTEQSTMKAETACRFAEAAEVDLIWFLTGEGSSRGLNADSYKEQENQNLGDKVQIPVLSVEVSAGGGTQSDSEQSNGTMAFRSEYLTGRGLQATSLCIVYAKGDSMEPEIQDGAAMLVNMADTKLDDGCIYIVRLNDHLYAKRVQHGFDGLKLVSANQGHGAIDVPRDRMSELNVIGRVVWSGREH